MAEHKRFKYQSAEELRKDNELLNLNIPFSTNVEVLSKPIQVGGKTIPNPLAVHPMEGCDGKYDGKPDELTFRRYERFARGGAGLLWVEASSVVPEGRANPRQLYICPQNKGSFEELFRHCINTAKDEWGQSHRPYMVLQLTHSGRYSMPYGKPLPVAAARNPYLDNKQTEGLHLISDEELETLEDCFAEAALLARDIGFDAVDIKSCHRYLVSELLSAFTREGKYGGSFENRTRFLLNIIDKIKSRAGDTIDITLRMNAYDAVPYPYGWGTVKEKGVCRPDINEPVELIKLLVKKGIKLVNISCGNPYYNPHIGRPYDNGPYIPPEHPLERIACMLGITGGIQKEIPEVALVATGFSWLRNYAPNIAAGGIKQGWFKLAGFGRQMFAYPHFARDIIEKGVMDYNSCCIACSKCTEIMRDGGKTGCVIKDTEIYGPIYHEGRKGKPSLVGKHLAEHI